MKLVVGLGNPGLKFRFTRHNIGALMVEKWAKNSGLNRFVSKNKLAAMASENKKVVLVRPQVFMNESGRTVKKSLKYFKIRPTDLLVVHDDSDLIIGQSKMQLNRGSAGHKGIESIVENLGAKNFWRLRIGVRPANEKIRQKSLSFILKNFSRRERRILEKIQPQIFSKIERS
ncbi:aminoacyl-tRNA hydrolase [uncultured Anoxybacillus sp.]|uniref:aminoacyl-tRNA hydrolase n=1 Tax=uncultured Anoxybacillus sp. TaxID=263860 RepID=UPI00345C53E9